MGVVSCLGHDLDHFYNNLLEGKSGVSMIEVSIKSVIYNLLLVKELPPTAAVRLPNPNAQNISS